MIPYDERLERVVCPGGKWGRTKNTLAGRHACHGVLVVRTAVVRSDACASWTAFNALFPKGAYFGEIALIGPANLFDLHPVLDVHLTQNVTVTTDWIFFWRQSIRDGIYGPAVNLIRSGPTSRARYIGSQATVQAEWQLGRHMTLMGIYTHFFAGAFLKETGPGQDVDYVTTWVIYRF
jgi:Alginate export